MNQLALSFTQTRARRSDPDTSREAAKNAASNKAALERIAIQNALRSFPPGLTAREIATMADLDYFATQRRISECAGIERTGERRDGCAVWVATR